ncbi:MAG: tRNA (adenosine(37)-N6)-dimethylallyltransferase MiaA [Methylacidiphilales bacterium]|nr:tRNA (adenosine(37)-N6)-dimethylallyltransferase MiaA [Candidatus Methylacidiphilales bacterium]
MPIFIVGATGTGKSALAMELARAFASTGGAAILVMDAMQVYRGADIGTSKASAAERAEVPHGGLDLADFGAAFDVAQYVKHAENFLREQQAAGRQVMVVGGTGLYFRALTRGLCKAPQGSEELRAELNGLPVEELQARLRKIDPGMLERLDRSNPRRLVRAIEVMEGTGRSLREWQEETPEPVVKDFRAFWIQREKDELQERIEARVEEMFARGWVEEVRELVGQYGLEAVRNFAGIGYREIGEMLAGEGFARRTQGTRRKSEEEDWPNPPVGTSAATRESMPEDSVVQNMAATLKRDILVATRQYAKRQLTWFAREPNLQPVMLSGNQPFPAVVPSLL